MEVGTTAIAAYLREYEGERILVLNNLTKKSQEIHLPFKIPATATEIITQTFQSPAHLAPYQYLWIRL